jgi:hypothetical protein
MARKADHKRRVDGILLPLKHKMENKITAAITTRPTTTVNVGNSLIAMPLKAYARPSG